MAPPSLESLLESCYPVCHSLIADGLLTAQELASLKHSSKRLDALVKNTPILCIKYIHAFSENPIWAARIGQWGISAAEGIYAGDDNKNDPSGGNNKNDPAGPGDATFKALTNVKKLDKPKLQSSIRLLTLSTNLRKLYLDGTEADSQIACHVLQAEEYRNLEEFSLVSCRNVLAQDLWGKIRELDDIGKERRLKKLRVWDVGDIVSIIWNAWAENESVVLPKVVQERVDALVGLSGRFDLDTTLCSRHKKPVPAHIRRVECMGCHTEKIVDVCPMCVLTRTCEVCLGEYCEKCNPWPELESAPLISIQNPSNPSGDTQEDGASAVSISTCGFPDTWWHEGIHRFHKDCIEKLPNTPPCKYCDKESCRWTRNIGYCDVCEEGICVDCSGNAYECGICNMNFCDEHFEIGVMNTGIMKRCKGLDCEFWMCGICEDNRDKNKIHYNFEHEMCIDCVGYFIENKDIRQLSDAESPVS